MEKIKYIFKKIILIILISSVSIFLYKIFIEIQEEINKTDTYGTRLSAEENINSDEEKAEIVNVIEEVSKCVVGVSKIRNNGSTVFLSNSEESLGMGTGVIISNKGYILTNEHVAGQKGQTCYLTIETGENYKGKVIWINSDIDLAIIKVEKIFNKKATLGNSDSINLGENVYAIGNPIGLEFQRTVTSGIISAVDRTVKIKNNDNSYSYMSNLIQTDATINPGNSGGPLIDENGNVIGINSIKITSAEGIGFAIPINIIKPIIEKIEENENFEEAYLGIFAYDGSIMSYINEDIKISEGVYVEEVIEDGPAQNAELQKGDIIFKIDNIKINKMIELQEYIFSKNPGDSVILEIERDSQRYSLYIILDKKKI